VGVDRTITALQGRLTFSAGAEGDQIVHQSDVPSKASVNHARQFCFSNVPALITITANIDLGSWEQILATKNATKNRNCPALMKCSVMMSQKATVARSSPAV
jgi:hypothetical protein